MLKHSIDRGVLLTHPQRYLLWKLAQHKYGWTYYSTRRGQWKVADALGRRGLVTVSERDLTIEATEAGREEIKRRWPVSPFALGTYEHQPGGWTPVEGVR